MSRSFKAKKSPNNQKYLDMNGKSLPKSFSKRFKVNALNESNVHVDDLQWFPCLELSLGELMHNEMFGLFEAMSAIEMMDPKMDAGMCCNKNTEPPLTFDTAVSVSAMNVCLCE